MNLDRPVPVFLAGYRPEWKPRRSFVSLTPPAIKLSTRDRWIGTPYQCEAPGCSETFFRKAKKQRTCSVEHGKALQKFERVHELGPWANEKS